MQRRPRPLLAAAIRVVSHVDSGRLAVPAFYFWMRKRPTTESPRPWLLGVFWRCRCPRSARALCCQCLLTPSAHGSVGALYASGDACRCLGSGGNPEGSPHLRPFLFSIDAQGPLFQKRAGASAARGFLKCGSHTHGASSASHLQPAGRLVRGAVAASAMPAMAPAASGPMAATAEPAYHAHSANKTD